MKYISIALLASSILGVHAQQTNVHINPSSYWAIAYEDGQQVRNPAYASARESIWSIALPSKGPSSWPGTEISTIMPSSQWSAYMSVSTGVSQIDATVKAGRCDFFDKTCNYDTYGFISAYFTGTWKRSGSTNGGATDVGSTTSNVPTGISGDMRGSTTAMPTAAPNVSNNASTVSSSSAHVTSPVQSAFAPKAGGLAYGLAACAFAGIAGLTYGL